MGSKERNMRCLRAWTSFGFAISMISAANVELPNVKIVDCKETSLAGFNTCLSVTFSYLEEYAGMNTVGSKNVLVGKLYGLDGTENEDSRVSASFESEKDFFVAIHDPSDEELYKLKVDLKTGDSQLWVLPKDIELDHPERPPGERLLRSAVPTDRQVAMPSSGFKMTVQPMVDQSFRNQHGSAVEERVNAIIEHAKTFFQHASLGTKFVLDLKPLHNYPNTLRATGSELSTLNSYVVGNGASLPLVNTYALLSMRDGSGPAGIAWLGTVCASRQWRTNINEYYGDLDTAQLLVHEIGHNLNMAHDFTNNNPDSPRYSSTGQPCTDIDSYMDYYNDPNRWSPCSVEDITAYYNSVGPEVYGNSCMTLLDDDTTTEAPPTDEVCINIKTTTKEWGRENSWTFGSCSSGQEYRSHKVYDEECCQPAGSYELVCKCSYGDGWHGGFIQIGDSEEKLCEDFEDGDFKTVDDVAHGDLEEVCINLKLTTKSWGSEIAWTFGSCSSKATTYGDNQEYDIECCQLAGTYELDCKDGYGDGWHGGQMEVGGNTLCEDFQEGHSQKQ